MLQDQENDNLIGLISPTKIYQPNDGKIKKRVIRFSKVRPRKNYLQANLVIHYFHNRSVFSRTSLENQNIQKTRLKIPNLNEIFLSKG